MSFNFLTGICTACLDYKIRELPFHFQVATNYFFFQLILNPSPVRYLHGRQVVKIHHNNTFNTNSMYAYPIMIKIC